MDKLSTCQGCGHVNPRGNTFCGNCGASMTGEPAPGGYGSPPPAYAPPAYGPPRRRSIVPWIVGGVIGCVLLPTIGILAAIALPNYIQISEKAKEAEIKQNLHAIQLGVERFSVDNSKYPAFLIGGEARCATSVISTSADNAFTNKVDCPTSTVSDVLVAEGYLPTYPTNPFTRNGIAIHQVQENMPSLDYPDDPLRNGSDTGEAHGTRFGADCTLMGNVLADPRFAYMALVDAHSDNTRGPATYAAIEYPFWDMWIGDKSLPFLPGQFFYKSTGPTKGAHDGSSETLAPLEISGYMLGGYGGIRTMGMDVLGDEQPGFALSPGEDGQYPPLWLWTRSELGNSSRGGSPFAPAPAGSGNQFIQGNANGIEDAIVITLGSGP